MRSGRCSGLGVPSLVKILGWGAVTSACWQLPFCLVFAQPGALPLPPTPQLCRKHKVGVLYCKAGQSSEEEMYNNEEAGPAFEEFLELLGEKVCLRGFGHYAAQLDTKSESVLQLAVGEGGGLAG